MNTLQKFREDLENKEYFEKVKEQLNYQECSCCKLLFDKSNISSKNGKCIFCKKLGQSNRS